jgi:hypothetical protein
MSKRLVALEEDGGLVRAGRAGGLLQTVSHALGSVALIRDRNDTSRLAKEIGSRSRSGKLSPPVEFHINHHY